VNDTRSGDQQVADYLRRVDLLLDHLPRSRRQELLDGLAEHIAAARAELPAERDDDVEAILARVGAPSRSPPPRPKRPASRSACARAPSRSSP
jgi:hypothetical protein